MKLIRFYLKLLLNKITIYLLICTVLLVNLVYVIEISNLDNSESITMNCFLFFSTSLFYVKLIICFVSIYLFSYFFTSKGDYSLYTLRMFNYKREEVYICKIISVAIIILLFVIVSLLFYLIWGLIVLNNILNVINCIKAFINVYFLALIYGGIGLILMQIINNYFVMIVTCVINLFVSGIEEVDGLSGVVCFVLPLLDEGGESVYGIVHLVWLSLIYFVLGYLIYNKRDLNY